VLLCTKKKTLAQDLPPDPVDEETSKLNELHLLIIEGVLMDTTGVVTGTGAATKTRDELSIKDQCRAQVIVNVAVHAAWMVPFFTDIFDPIESVCEKITICRADCH